jgi:predicted ATPase
LNDHCGNHWKNKSQNEKQNGLIFFDNADLLIYAGKGFFASEIIEVEVHGHATAGKYRYGLRDHLFTRYGVEHLGGLYIPIN